MVPVEDFDTDELLQRAEGGELEATQELFQRHRAKLRRMVEVRLDARLRQRFDPSDVVQETLAEGIQKWPEFLKARPLPFYAWLRQLAWGHLVDLHRRHIQSQRRSGQLSSPGSTIPTTNGIIVANEINAVSSDLHFASLEDPNGNIPLLTFQTTAQVVPEPASATLFLCGIFGFVCIFYARKCSDQPSRT